MNTIISNLLDLNICNVNPKFPDIKTGKIKNVKVVKTNNGYNFKLYGQLFVDLPKNETVCLFKKYYN